MMSSRDHNHLPNTGRSEGGESFRVNVGRGPFGFNPASPMPGGRLSLLLTSSDWRDDDWAFHVPRLLEPMGVYTLRARSAAEAQQLLRTVPVHISIVDLALPLDHTASVPAERGLEEGGVRILDLLARLPEPPPTLVVKRRKTTREDTRDVTAALRARAFAVIDRPVHLEILLESLRRALSRFYDNRWPHSPPSTA